MNVERSESAYLVITRPASWHIVLNLSFGENLVIVLIDSLRFLLSMKSMRKTINSGADGRLEK